MPANWTPFATAVLGGAVGAILTQAATFFRDWWGKREEGTFTALTMALELEAYALECTDPIFALSNYQSSRGATSEPNGSIPSLELPADTKWRSLGTCHSEAVLGLRVRVNFAQSALRDTWDFDGPVSAWGEAADYAIELGAEALRVATMLRGDFRLGPMPKRGQFDPLEFYKERLLDLTKRREAWEQRRVDFEENSTAT